MARFVVVDVINRRVQFQVALTAACLAGAGAAVAVRTASGPHQTQYGRYLHQHFERTVDTKRTYQPNSNPDLIAVAYRRTVDAGEATIATSGTDQGETYGTLNYSGHGVVWLSEGSAAITTSVTGSNPATVVIRVVRNDLYVQRPEGGLHWEGLPRNFGGPLNLPAGNFNAPLSSLQYLSTLHTPVRRGLVSGPGVRPCRGYLTSADEHGGQQGLRTATGVCLDSAGRISVASFRFDQRDRSNHTTQTFAIHLTHFGLHEPIDDPPNVQQPFKPYR